MKVLLIDVNCKGSSTGKIVYNLYTAINENGDEAAICYGRGPIVDEKNIFKFGLGLETYLHALLTRITGFTGCFSYFSTRRLINFIEDFKPDVIHIHELHAYFVNLKQLLTYIATKRIPVVWTFHCEFMYTGKCGHAYECENWKKGCGNCPNLTDYPRSLFFDHTAKMAREKKALLSSFNKLVIVTPSVWLSERVKQSFLLGREIKVIHNGIDTEIFHPYNTSKLRDELQIGKDEKIVLAVAPKIMSDNKGGMWILKLAEMMMHEHIKFIIVGVDNVNIPHSLNTIVLPIIFDQIRLAELYSMADVFVICSKRENFPTTCIEAQCCGTEVCGFDVGGVKETAVGVQNCFFAYGDLRGLYLFIHHILEENYDSDLISQRAFARFDKKMMISKYLELYRQMKKV